MNIKYLCSKKKISMKQLAEKSGVSLTYLYELNRGKKVPSVTIALKIAKVLKVSLKKLLEDVA